MFGKLHEGDQAPSLSAARSTDSDFLYNSPNKAAPRGKKSD